MQDNNFYNENSPENLFSGEPQNNSDYNTNIEKFKYLHNGLSPEQYLEKSEIKRDSSTIGISLLVMSGISFFWAVIYYIIMTLFLRIDIVQAQDIISEPMTMQFAQVVLSSILFTLPFIIIYKLKGYRISELLPLSKPEKKSFLPLFLIGISFCAFANVVVSYAGSIFESFGIHYEVDFGENPQGILGFIISLFSTVAIPALVEEFACRGLILGCLKKHGEGFAIVCSSIIFGIMHGNFQQIPFAFLVGLVLGFITVKGGSLWIAIAVHAFNNFISVFFSYCMGWLSTQGQNLAYSLFLALCMVAGIIGVCIYKKDGGYNFKKENTNLSQKQKYKYFFKNPLIIIFIIISVLEAIVFFF